MAFGELLTAQCVLSYEQVDLAESEEGVCGDESCSHEMGYLRGSEREGHEHSMGCSRDFCIQ